MNRLQHSEAKAPDPHAMQLMPQWAEVQVLTHPGSKVFFRVKDNILFLFIRDSMSVGWPRGTPQLLPGEQVYEINPPTNAWFCRSNLSRPVDHPFTPSPFDSGMCRICALPSRMRWKLEFFRKTEHNGEAKYDRRWFDDHDEALQDRMILAADPDIIALGLEQAIYRDDPDAQDAEG